MSKKELSIQEEKELLLDPRQQLCWDLYIDPKSETFGNAKQSAIKAGYELSTSDHITRQDWWLVKARRLSMLSKAEKNLNEFMEVEVEEQAVGMFGPVFSMQSQCCNSEVETVKEKGKRPVKFCSKCEKECKVIKTKVMKRNTEVMKMKLDASKFVAERLGRRDGYSPHKGGEGLPGETVPTPLLAHIINVQINHGSSQGPEAD